MIIKEVGNVSFVLLLRYRMLKSTSAIFSAGCPNPLGKSPPPETVNCDGIDLLVCTSEKITLPPPCWDLY